MPSVYVPFLAPRQSSSKVASKVGFLSDSAQETYSQGYFELSSNPQKPRVLGVFFWARCDSRRFGAFWECGTFTSFDIYLRHLDHVLPYCQRMQEQLQCTPLNVDPRIECQSILNMYTSPDCLAIGHVAGCSFALTNSRRPARDNTNRTWT